MDTGGDVSPGHHPSTWVGRLNDRHIEPQPNTVGYSSVRATGATDPGGPQLRQWYIHVDLTGIQSYVYRSRTLLDGIGRAAQIEDLTDPAWLESHHILESGQHLVHRGAGAITFGVDDTSSGESEVPPETVRTLVSRYTRAVFDVSDALSPVVAIQLVPDKQAPHDALDLAAKLLVAARHTTLPHLAGALPHAAVACTITGVPATTERRRPDGTVVPVADEALRARSRGRDWHRERQEQWLSAAPLPSGLEFALPTSIDALGRSESVTSHIAVLVIDVNDLGAILASVEHRDTATVADALRGLTNGMVQAMIDRVAIAVTVREEPDGTAVPWVSGAPVALEFPLHRSDSDGIDEIDDVDANDARKWLLPIRPWVTAGDDVVLVCESRIAWTLAAAVIDWLDSADTAHTDEHDPRTRLRKASPVFGRDDHLAVTVGIGIAVVPVGYSLAAAHDLAAGLCTSAKQTRRLHHSTDGGHIVDWYRGTADPAVVLSDRADPGGGLRPYHSPPPWQPHRSNSATWEHLLTALDPARTDGIRGTGTWADRRSWVKTDLRAAALASDPTTESLDGVIAAKIAREVALTGTTLPTPRLLLAPVPPTWAPKGSIVVDVIDLLDDHLILTDHRLDPAPQKDPAEQDHPAAQNHLDEAQS